MIATWVYILAAVIIFIVLLLAKLRDIRKFRPKPAKGEPSPGFQGIPAIVEVKYLGTVPGEQKRGGFKGAVLGGLFFGDAGSLIGGLAPLESEPLHRFEVRYDNGKVIIDDCSEGSARYDAYKRHLYGKEL